MSETIANVQAHFPSGQGAKAAVRVLSKWLSRDLLSGMKANGVAERHLETVDEGWFLGAADRKGAIASMKVIGPPSGGNIDGLLLWLRDEGAGKIEGDIGTTLADYDPTPFALVDGKLQEIERPTPDSAIHRRDGIGNTPLHLAAEKGSIKKIRELLLTGADIEAKNNRGATPIFMAVFDGHVEVVAYLIDHGARTDVHIDYGSMRKASILDVAVDGWDEAMVDFLESKGVKQKSKCRLKLDYDVLRQVFNVYSEEGFNIMETLNRVNRMKLPTPAGAKAWTLVMVTKAAKLVGG